mgnify:CR=1 FL=1
MYKRQRHILRCVSTGEKGNRCNSCTISSLYTGNAESCVYAQSLGNWEDDSGVLICKSGNLLCMHRVDASDESFHSKTIMGYGMSENFRLDF